MLGENIKTIRKNKGYTQEELAVRLNVTRQTVSKWEKGYSVPDAAVLAEMSEVLETSVQELLGADKVPAAQNDALIDQLSRLNEQLAVRNRRTKRIWRTIGIVLLAIVVIYMGLVAISAARYTDNEIAGQVGWEITLDDETYEYEVGYDSNYEIIAQGGDAHISVIPNLDDYTDVNLFELYLTEYVESRGGTVERSSTSGLEMP